MDKMIWWTYVALFVFVSGITFVVKSSDSPLGDVAGGFFVGVVTAILWGLTAGVAA